MKNLVILSLLVCGIAWSQPVTICWAPEGGQQTCQTLQSGTATMVTVDLRQTPAVVIQPIPQYQLDALQAFVDGQTYNQLQPNGSLQVKPRYQSVQDLLVQHLIKAVIVPALKQNNAENASPEQVKSDLLSVMTFFPIL